MKTYYITTAISYPNGQPHIGHAYEIIATDAIARFMRLDGYDVRFLTGTDEHGQKMQRMAAEKDLSATAFADQQAPLFQAMAKALNCSNDDFIRTTEPRHYAASQALWEMMQKRGDIYLDNYSGWYSVRDEAYYADSETELRDDGIRYGSQGTPVEWVEEESYFFRLSAYQDRLLSHYEDSPHFIGPNERRNEIISFVKGGLRDLSISRTTFDWGIPVPDHHKHVMYVWVDALTNYITALGFPDENNPLWQYWPANLHVIGKDIVRFHAVYWPAFLMSAGVPLPKRIFAHGFLFNRGQKMSKSVGNVVDPHALIAHYGVDPLRYFLLREVPFGNDGSYSHEAIVRRINSDLANDLGNLAQRSLSMIYKNLDGKLSAPDSLTSTDTAMLDHCDALLDICRKTLEEQKLHQSLNAIWSVVSEANRYFAAQEPWALKKTDPIRMATVLWVTAEVIRNVALLLQAFMPTSASAFLDLLSIPPEERQFNHFGITGRLKDDTSILKPTPIFPRYIDDLEAG